MLHTTDAIVLSLQPQSDKAHILHAYTRTGGRVNYKVYGLGRKHPIGMYMPLSLIQITADYPANGLPTIRETVLQRSGLTAKRSYSETVLQPSGLTAKRSDSETVLQPSGLTAKRSDSETVLQPSGLTAKRSYSETVLQPSGLTAKRSYSETVLQRSGLTAKRSYSETVLQRSGLYKQTVSLFISEVLYHVLRHPMPDEPMFEFIEQAIKLLDQTTEPQNFHLQFLISFAAKLGFAIENEPAVPQTRKQRQDTLNDLCAYFATHVETWETPKSLDILTEVFD